MITSTQLMAFLQLKAPAWVTATVYKVGYYVTQSSTVYECLIEHTSGVFATDLAALKWTASHFVGQCVDNAISEVNSACNRDFRVGSYTDYFEGNGSVWHYVKNPPATDLESIKYLDEDATPPDYVTIFTGSDTLANNAIYDKEGYRVRLLHGYGFQSGKQYEIVYTGGAVPGDVAQVTLEKAAMLYKNNKAGRLGVGSQNLGGQSATGESFNENELILKHEKILGKYRLINV